MILMVGVRLVDGGDSGVEQPCEIGPSGRRRGPERRSRAEQNAGGDLVSDLHHVGPRACGDERLDVRQRVVVKVRHRGVDVVVHPRRRLGLLARVGPGVAVVKVEEKAHPGGLDLLSERDGVREVAESLRGVGRERAAGRVRSGLRRVDERPHAHVVETVILEE